MPTGGRPWAFFCNCPARIPATPETSGVTALDRLAAVNPRAAELVKLRYFAGLTGREAAGVLGISPRKADQVWAYARAWLLDRLNDAPG